MIPKPGILRLYIYLFYVCFIETIPSFCLDKEKNYHRAGFLKCEIFINYAFKNDCMRIQVF